MNASLSSSPGRTKELRYCPRCKCMYVNHTDTSQYYVSKEEQLALMLSDTQAWHIVCAECWERLPGGRNDPC